VQLGHDPADARGNCDHLGVDLRVVGGLAPVLERVLHAATHDGDDRDDPEDQRPATLRRWRRRLFEQSRRNGSQRDGRLRTSQKQLLVAFDHGQAKLQLEVALIFVKNRRSPMKTTVKRDPVRRTGGRSARVVEEVLRTTLEEIDRVGYGALRVEEVAARSGVNKTTIYRRWPTKAELVAAAVRATKVPVAFANTGDLQADLTDGFVSSLERADTPNMRGLLRMVQTEREHPEVDALVNELRETHSRARITRLRAAIADGQLPKSTDVELVHLVLAGAVFGRLARLGERLPSNDVAKIVALVLAGAGVRPPARKRR